MKGVLEALENKIFFVAQPWWEDLYRLFKNFSVDFTIEWCYFCEFLEKIREYKISKFMFLPLSGILKISERKKKKL